MGLNPFEQLRFFVSDPRTAFEEVVGILLLDHGKSDGQVERLYNIAVLCHLHRHATKEWANISP
jgi:hypothetical protein